MATIIIITILILAICFFIYINYKITQDNRDRIQAWKEKISSKWSDSQVFQKVEDQELTPEEGAYILIENFRFRSLELDGYTNI